MQKIYNTVYDAIISSGPATPWILLTIAIWLSIYALRRFAPGIWLAIERKLGDNHIALALPGMLVGTITSAVASGGDIGQAWKGALAGAVAPMLHHALKSYDGADTVLDAAEAKFLSPKIQIAVAVKEAAVVAVAAEVLPAPESASVTPVMPTQVIVAAPLAIGPQQPTTLPAIPSAIPAPPPSPKPGAVS